MSLSPAPRQTLADAALLLLDHARGESERGFAQDDRIFVMDAAEKAWNAVCHGIDHLMTRKGRTPAVGRDAHSTRSEFLEAIGHHDLAISYAYFADTLHGMFFYEGRVPRTRTDMDRRLGEVEAFLRALRETE
jgi:hypothetical protein